jgi:uncharacterized membrane protein
MQFRRNSGLRLSVLIIAGTLSLVLLLLSLLTPLLPGNLTRVTDPVLSVTCHRLPFRSLLLPWGITGLCARCTAFWAGMTVGVAMALVTGRRILGLSAAFLLLLPMILDGSLQYLGLYESSSTIRVLTGASCGLGLASILAALSTKRGGIPPG